MDTVSKTETPDWSKKLPSQILFEAANTLEERNNWIQGQYLKLRSNETCFCAHGAIQACGLESKARTQLLSKTYRAADALHIKSIADASSTGGEMDGPSFLRNLHQYQDDDPSHYNLFLAHTFAWKVGCSFVFNDQYGQTKEAVIAKLRQAAAYALEHQHKYLNPSSSSE